VVDLDKSTPDARPSTRLVQVLWTYCTPTRLGGLDDLRASLQAGRYPWLRDELGRAISGHAFEPAQWAVATSGAPAGQPATLGDQELERDQRRLWDALFPGQPLTT
jgi:hypothetical protein